MQITYQNLSLKQHMLLRIALILWNQPDIGKALIGVVCDDYCSWNPRNSHLFNEIISRANMLDLPPLLRTEVIWHIQTVGTQMVQWMLRHQKLFSQLGQILPWTVIAGFLNQLCWQSQGVIDKQKTARLLTTHPKLNITVRYKLACFYCIEQAVYGTKCLSRSKRTVVLRAVIL